MYLTMIPVILPPKTADRTLAIFGASDFNTVDKAAFNAAASILPPSEKLWTTASRLLIMLCSWSFPLIPGTE